MRDLVVQAANAAIGSPGDASLAFACLLAAGLEPPERITSLRTIGFPEVGEVRSKDNVPLPGDLAHFDDLGPGVIVEIDETHVTVVAAQAGTVIDVALVRESLGPIYSIRSLLEPRGTDAEEHAKLVAKLQAGATEDELRADGVSVGDARRAASALTPAPTSEEQAATVRAALKASVRAEAEARLSQIRRSKLREELQTEVVSEMLAEGDITEDERAALDPPKRAVAQTDALEAAQLKGGARG